MADYTTITMQYNTGTDAAPVWTGTALQPQGTSGANELRMALSGGGATGSTGSASWPFMAIPGSGTQAVGQLWAFSSDTTGVQIATYTGDNTKANVLRWSFDNLGTPTSAMQLTCFGDSTHTTPSPGTQSGIATHNDAFTNGQASDTSSTSYLKINAYGSGFPSGGAQETPAAGSVGTLPTATTGAAGGVTGSAAHWLNSNGAWQSGQGWLQYLSAPATVAATTAFFWYVDLVFFIGANIATGTWTPVLTLQYNHS